MATLRMATLWKDPRNGTLMLRKRIPKQYQTVSGHSGNTVKISTGTADRKEAERRLPDVLKRWAAMLAEWERKRSEVALTPDRARELAAQWAAWIAGGGTLETGGIAASAFDLLVTVPDPTMVPAVWARVEAHADETLALAGITITAATRHFLLGAMEGVVQAAYADAELKRSGGQDILGPEEPPPLDLARARLPPVLKAPTTLPPPKAPAVPLSGLFDAWKSVASVKARVVAETRYAVEMLRSFIGHEDATQVSRDDLIRWRIATIDEGRMKVERMIPGTTA